MKNLRELSFALVLLSTGFAPGTWAELCSMDAVPAATLLLPYFEVDVANPGGKTTVMSINNATAEATLAHVTLWTDWALPTLRFDVYLTGYDVQTLNLRDLLNGQLPQTAIASQDPTDTISPRGSLSQDGDFPGCPIVNVLPPVLGDSLLRAHRGLDAPPWGGCVAHPHGDLLARGYVTVDVVSRCSVLAPSDAGYFPDVAAARNVLWGSYFFLHPENNSAQQENLVHIESCDPTVVPEPGGCPFGALDYTFYGRYTNAAEDQREPLASTFATSFVTGGAFAGGTRLVVWRDTKATVETAGACGRYQPSWFPLFEREAHSFDEQENPQRECDGPSFDPPSPACFRLATQQPVLGAAPSIAGYPPNPSADFGWLFLNLSHGDVNVRFPGQAQAWVSAVSTASGRYSVATDAVALDQLCDPDAGSQTLLP
jgi:hypothetical protein